MKSRKKGILFLIAAIVCLVMWIFIDRNWGNAAVGCAKIILMISIFFLQQRLAHVPTAESVEYRYFCRGKNIHTAESAASALPIIDRRLANV